jgi:hypothetical protein
MANNSRLIRVSDEFDAFFRDRWEKHCRDSKESISMIEFSRVLARNGNGHAPKQRFPLW